MTINMYLIYFLVLFKFITGCRENKKQSCLKYLNRINKRSAYLQQQFEYMTAVTIFPIVERKQKERTSRFIYDIEH